jgi:plasmid stabilization system protein ParE
MTFRERVLVVAALKEVAGRKRVESRTTPEYNRAARLLLEANELSALAFKIKREGESENERLARERDYALRDAELARERADRNHDAAKAREDALEQTITELHDQLEMERDPNCEGSLAYRVAGLVDERERLLAILRRHPQTAYESAIKDQLRRAADFLESGRVRHHDHLRGAEG